MCKTIYDSILSGSVSYITGFLLIYLNKPEYIWLGIFILVVGSTQWIDALIWYNKQHNISTKEISKYGIITILVLELLVSYLGYVYYSRKRIIPFEILLLVGIVNFVYTWISDCEDTTVAEDGYLKWCNISFKNNVKDFIMRAMFMIALFFPFIYFPDTLLRNAIMFSGFLSWLINYNTETFGSRWCHSFYLLDSVVILRLLYNYTL